MGKSLIDLVNEYENSDNKINKKTKKEICNDNDEIKELINLFDQKVAKSYYDGKSIVTTNFYRSTEEIILYMKFKLKNNKVDDYDSLSKFILNKKDNDLEYSFMEWNLKWKEISSPPDKWESSAGKTNLNIETNYKFDKSEVNSLEDKYKRTLENEEE